MKNLFIQFDIFLKEAGVGTALFFVMILLMYVNTLSLYEMFQERNFSLLPALIGAVAFSITTVVVMRREGFLWAKLIVPVFDFFLMFLGFNINYLFKDNNTTAFIGLSLFFSVFAAFITGVLGFINYKERKNETTNSQSIELMQIENDRLRKENDALEYVNNENIDTIKALQKDIDKHLPNSLKYQLWNLRKSNNHDEAAKVMEQIEQFENQTAVTIN